MKLIAVRSFRNPPGKFRVEVKNPSHAHHVDKGTRFAIGNPDTELDDLPEGEKLLAAMLIASTCVAEETPESIERVAAELAQDELREANAAGRDEQARLVEIGGLAAALGLSVNQATAQSSK